MKEQKEDFQVAMKSLKRKKARKEIEEIHAELRKKGRSMK